MPTQTIHVKSKNQENISNNTPATDSTKSKIPVGAILFGSTTSSYIITGVTLAVFIVSIFDLIWTLSNYTPDWWDPKISGIITMLTSMTVSALLMISLNRKMNTTVTPLVIYK